MRQTIAAKVLARFISKVEVRGMDECWPWKASTARGYGQFSVSYGSGERKMWKAHRFMYALAVDPNLEDGVMVCHHCDNPPCCNPSHFFPGTADDNNKDMVNKGRQVRLLRSMNPMWGKAGPNTGKIGKLSASYGRKHSAKTRQQMKQAQLERWAKQKAGLL